MATENTMVIGVTGDFGNPNGTGVSKIVASRIWPSTVKALSDSVTLATAFHAALKTAQLTATNQGDLSQTAKSPATPDKPEASVNVDRILKIDWREKSASSLHTISIPGVPVVSTGLDKLAEGERLNDVGKAAAAAALETYYDLTADTIVILSGVVIQKK